MKLKAVNTGKALSLRQGRDQQTKTINENLWYEAELDPSFYEKKWILKFSLKCHLMNEIKIFLFGLKELEQCLKDFSCIISLWLFLLFKQ